MPDIPQTELEYLTRRKRIDPELAAQGWTITPFNEQTSPTAYARHAVTEYPTSNGPADYALFSAGRLLGIVEAKKVTLGLPAGIRPGQSHSTGSARWSL